MPPVRYGRLGVRHAGELLTVQRAAFVTEAQLYDTPHLDPLTETLEDLTTELGGVRCLGVGAWLGSRLVGGVRLRIGAEAVQLGRLAVAPDMRRRGIATGLLAAAERLLPDGSTVIELFTGQQSDGNLELYHRAGYSDVHLAQAPGVTFVHMRKVLGAKR